MYMVRISKEKKGRMGKIVSLSFPGSRFLIRDRFFMYVFNYLKHKWWRTECILQLALQRNVLREMSIGVNPSRSGKNGANTSKSLSCLPIATAPRKTLSWCMLIPLVQPLSTLFYFFNFIEMDSKPLFFDVCFLHIWFTCIVVDNSCCSLRLRSPACSWIPISFSTTDSIWIVSNRETLLTIF